MDLISGAYMSVFLDSDFVTGQPATKRIQELYGPPHSQVQELSELAIKRAALMKLTSPEAYFNYLYAYNTCPANLVKNSSRRRMELFDRRGGKIA